MINQNACGVLIKRIHDRIEKDANNALRPRGLTLSQITALVAISDTHNREISLKELEKTLHVAQSTVVGIISRLEEKGLVVTVGDSSDRRIKKAQLTEAGMRRAQEAEVDMLKTEERILSGLTKDEQTNFLSLLEKVANSMN